MAAFKSKVAQEVWVEHWCVRCYRMRGEPVDKSRCDILAKALRTNKKPKEWEKNPHASTMATQVKCTAFARKPPRPTKVQQFEDVSMFDDDTLQGDGRFVPVPGWPDRPTKNEGDHA